ncbi:caspase isoform X3 [Eurytemora carolleeae]|uniref:caspase isoform X3 n=1 Tax=Eurytemora carolleeae TaxID=1294199 RepID=UPI000C78FC7F|nr:caspase isoform X3 [Eurytemora carolleeae]|eukprot:XP_023326454.1 caspase-like isoform X3 [Eurytemora affinis]
MDSKENIKIVQENLKNDLKEDDINIVETEVATMGVDEQDAKPAAEINKEISEDESDAKSFIREIFQSHHHQDHHEKKEQEEFKPPLKESDEEKLIRLVKINGNDTYSTEGKRRGICMIFENDMFHTDLGLSKRKGSNVDRVLMIDVFTKLQFEVRVFQNLTTTEILQKLEAARFEDHSHSDMFAIVILSHGNEGILYGYDRPYAVQKIWEPFTAANCEDLAGKPKLFFIQACQGSQIDHGVTVEEKKKSRTETDGFASYRTPLHSDFMIAHSTVAGYYSWRNTVQGSWFIQVLGAALLVNASKVDLITILT